ncbi:hypothetical protein Stsp01_65520 [Streptomyces sp. NBRC 13847]|nr:hypothetical protein Stsp01_65520 [Streptomyces sp. NBRC 13847]
MFQRGTIVQHIAVSEHWGAYGKVADGFGDGESYIVDLLAPRTGTVVWGHRSVARVWDGPAVSEAWPAIRPGGTLPIPGLRPMLQPRRPALPQPVVGSLAEAAVAADWCPECSPYGDPAGWRPVGEGAHRAVILNPDRTTVYKIETCRGPQPARTPHPRRAPVPGVWLRPAHHDVDRARPRAQQTWRPAVAKRPRLFQPTRVRIPLQMHQTDSESARRHHPAGSIGGPVAAPEPATA